MSLFQSQVRAWCESIFGTHVTNNKAIRAFRFFEEATEAVQAGSMSREDAHRLVDYVYDRPVGEVRQEVGGTYLTLAAFCNAHDIDMLAEASREFDRCMQPEVIEKIKAKQKTKPNPVDEECRNGDAGGLPFKATLLFDNETRVIEGVMPAGVALIEERA